MTQRHDAAYYGTEDEYLLQQPQKTPGFAHAPSGMLTPQPQAQIPPISLEQIAKLIKESQGKLRQPWTQQYIVHRYPVPFDLLENSAFRFLSQHQRLHAIEIAMDNCYSTILLFDESDKLIEITNNSPHVKKPNAPPEPSWLLDLGPSLERDIPF